MTQTSNVNFEVVVHLKIFDCYTLDCFCCVFVPYVLPVTQSLPHVDCLFDSRCVSFRPSLSCLYKSQSFMLVFVGSTSDICVPFLIPCVDLSCVLDLIKVYFVYPRLRVPSGSNCDRRPDPNCNLRVYTTLCLPFFSLSVFVSVVFPYWSPPLPGIPPPPAGAVGEIARGPHQTVPGPRKPHHLPGQCALCVIQCQLELLVQNAVVRGWPSSEFRHLCGVDTGEKWISACSQENIASSTSDPVPSPPSPRCAERMPEPTTDLEPEPSVNDEQSLHGATEPRTAEQELLMTSVKVREPATTSASRERAMDGVSAERSSTPCTVAEGELRMACGLCHSKEERAPFPEFSPRRTPVPAPRKYPPEPATLECPSVPAPRKSPSESASVEHTPVWAPVPEFSPGSLEAHKYSPSHLLLPPPPLSSCSHSARPQFTIYAVRALRDCHPPTSPWSEFPSSPPPASEARTMPGPIDHGS